MEPTEIRYLAPFSALPPAERAAVASAARIRRFRHRERPFVVDDACVNVTFVLDGVVRLFRVVPDGMEVTISLASRDDVLGGAGLRGGTKYDASAEAIGYVRTIEIPTATFLPLTCRFPRLFQQFAWELAAQTNDLYQDTVTDVQKELSSRVLHTLRILAKATDTSGSDATLHPMTHRLSHAEIARIVGAHRSSVTRALRLLDDQHLIRREQGHVTAVRS